MKHTVVLSPSKDEAYSTSLHSGPMPVTVQAAVVLKACDTELVNVYPENM